MLTAVVLVLSFVVITIFSGLSSSFATPLVDPAACAPGCGLQLPSGSTGAPLVVGPAVQCQSPPPPPPQQQRRLHALQSLSFQQGGPSLLRPADFSLAPGSVAGPWPPPADAFAVLSNRSAGGSSWARQAGLMLADPLARSTFAGYGRGLPRGGRELLQQQQAPSASPPPPPAAACVADTSVCYACYCSILADEGDLVDSGAYCASFFSDLMRKVGLGLVASLIIVFVNLMMPFVLEWSTHFERHVSMSAEQSSMAYKLFVSTLVNTVLVTVIVGAYLPGIQSLFSNSALGSLLFAGAYSDVTPAWYQTIGRSLIITLAATPAFNRLLTALQWPAKWARLRAARTALNQRTMNELVTGPPFVLSSRYGEAISSAFACLIFNSTMPVLAIVGYLDFALRYWTSKAELLTLAQYPPAYGPHIAGMMARMLPWAAVAHLSFAIWVRSLALSDPRARSSRQCFPVPSFCWHQTDSPTAPPPPALASPAKGLLVLPHACGWHSFGLGHPAGHRGRRGRLEPRLPLAGHAPRRPRPAAVPAERGAAHGRAGGGPGHHGASHGGRGRAGDIPVRAGVERRGPRRGAEPAVRAGRALARHRRPRVVQHPGQPQVLSRLHLRRRVDIGGRRGAIQSELFHL